MPACVVILSQPTARVDLLHKLAVWTCTKRRWTEGTAAARTTAIHAPTGRRPPLRGQTCAAARDRACRPRSRRTWRRPSCAPRSGPASWRHPPRQRPACLCVGTHKADKVVDGGLVRANGVEQRVCGGVSVVALGDGVPPGLCGTLGLRRGRRRGEHFVNLRGGVVKQFLIHSGSSLSRRCEQWHAIDIPIATETFSLRVLADRSLLKAREFSLLRRIA